MLAGPAREEAADGLVETDGHRARARAGGRGGLGLLRAAAAPLLASLGVPVPQAGESEDAGAATGRRGGSGGPTPVVAVPVVHGQANGRISAIGDGRALRSVAVTPLASGRIEDIVVRSGQRVAAGDLLAVLDSEAEEIEVARAELARRDAEATLERIERLRQTGSTTDVAAREAQLAVDRAALELRDAELALDRRRITAPIDGIVGIVPVDPGVQVSTSTEVVTIDDRSRILVEFRVPERWVGELAEGDPIEATALAQPGRPLDGEILALDNRIDQASRTLRIQAVIDNADDSLRAGMAFRIAMAFEGETYPAVDPLAIQWGSDGAFVWQVRDGEVARVPVRIVQRSAERVLVAAELAPATSS
jgi:RND family efflux transporter MFP subunit